MLSHAYARNCNDTRLTGWCDGEAEAGGHPVPQLLLHLIAWKGTIQLECRFQMLMHDDTLARVSKSCMLAHPAQYAIMDAACSQCIPILSQKLQ